MPKTSLVQRHDCLLALGWALLIACGGCNDGGLVTANGRITLEEKLAEGGRLILYPTGSSGEGTRADSHVTETGEFALHTAGRLGAKPGSYRVLFKTTLTGEQARMLAQNPNLIVDELNVVYETTDDNPITIPQSDTEDLTIAINSKHGWKRQFSD